MRIVDGLCDGKYAIALLDGTEERALLDYVGFWTVYLYEDPANYGCGFQTAVIDEGVPPSFLAALDLEPCSSTPVTDPVIGGDFSPTPVRRSMSWEFAVTGANPGSYRVDLDTVISVASAATTDAVGLTFQITDHSTVRAGDRFTSELPLVMYFAELDVFPNLGHDVPCSSGLTTFDEDLGGAAGFSCELPTAGPNAPLIDVTESLPLPAKRRIEVADHLTISQPLAVTVEIPYSNSLGSCVIVLRTDGQIIAARNLCPVTPLGASSYSAVSTEGAPAPPTTDAASANPTTEEVLADDFVEFAGEVRPVEIEGEPLPIYSPIGVDPALGMRPPLFVAEDVNGSAYTISPNIAGPVMVVFLAHWCPACNEEIPEFAELERGGRLPDGIQIFGVLTGTAPDRPNFPPSRWVADRGWPWPAVIDGSNFDQDPPRWAAADAFGLSAYPYVVFTLDGVVVDRWSGGLGVDGLEARINAALD